MTSKSIPDDIQRFILRSIESVPHLEALLLLRRDPAVAWDARSMAQRLYLSERNAAAVLDGLCASGFAMRDGATHTYRYYPASHELRDLLDRVARLYSRQLIEVTALIHSKIGRQAQTFGDAFKWQREKE